MILYTDMLAKVRRHLKDESGNIWTDETVKAAVLDAIREVGLKRPESRLRATGHLRGVATAAWPDEPEAVIPLDDWYGEAVAAQALSFLYMRDAGDLKDEGLGTYWANRVRELIGG